MVIPARRITRKCGSPLLKIIDISGDGHYRRDPFKLPDHMRTTDIAGMQNAGDARKVLDARLIEYAMASAITPIRTALGASGAVSLMGQHC